MFIKENYSIIMITGNNSYYPIMITKTTQRTQERKKSPRDKLLLDFNEIRIELFIIYIFFINNMDQM